MLSPLAFFTGLPWSSRKRRDNEFLTGSRPLRPFAPPCAHPARTLLHPFKQASTEAEEGNRLVVAVTGWIQVGDHCKYEIVTMRRQAGRLEQIEQVGKSRQRFSAFLRLHQAIGESLGVSFPLPKQLFLFNNERWLRDDQTRCRRYQYQLLCCFFHHSPTRRTLPGGCATNAPPSLVSTSTPRSATRRVEPLNKRPS